MVIDNQKTKPMILRPNATVEELEALIARAETEAEKSLREFAAAEAQALASATEYEQGVAFIDLVRGRLLEKQPEPPNTA